MTAHPPVHVDVVLPDTVWQRLHLDATARDTTIANVIAEAIVRHLAAKRRGSHMDEALAEIDRHTREQQRLTGLELLAEVDALLSLGLNPREICRELGRTPGSILLAARRANRRDLAQRFTPLDAERKHVA